MKMLSEYFTVRRRRRRRILVIHACTSQAEEFGGRCGEKDVTLGGNERQAWHDHGLDQVAIDDQPHFNRVGRKGQNVRERADWRLFGSF